MVEWKPIRGFPKYEVSNVGQVRRIAPGQHTRPGKILRAAPTPAGYLTVRLYPGGRTKYIHRLVARMFIGPRPKGFQINHKDGNKVNNTVENLEYISARGNADHALRTGLWRRKGTANPKAKLRDEDVEQIRDLASKGISSKKIAEMFGVTRRLIYQIVAGKIWKHLL